MAPIVTRSGEIVHGMAARDRSRTDFRTRRAELSLFRSVEDPVPLNQAPNWGDGQPRGL